MRNPSDVPQELRDAALQYAVGVSQVQQRMAGGGERQHALLELGPASDSQDKHGRGSPLYLGPDGMHVQPVARIFQPSRSVMTSSRPRTKNWRLAFERRTVPYVEPLMGWTGDDDVMAQVVLDFPTLEAAISYCTRQSLAYVVQHPRAAAPEAPKRGRKYAPHGSDRKAPRPPANRNDPADAERWDRPWSIVM